MQLQQLRCFDAVVRTGSLRRAAHELQLSQPSVSDHIRHLEQDLGVVLFVRTSRGSEPTEAAWGILTAVRSMLEAEQGLRKTANALSALPHAHMRLAAVPTACATVVPTLLTLLGGSSQELVVRVVESDGESVVEGLRDGSFDLGLIVGDESAPKELADLRTTRLSDVRMVSYASPTDRRCGDSRVSPERLAELPLVVPSPGTLLHKVLLEYLQTNDLRISCYTSSHSTALLLARRGIGIAVVAQPLTTESIGVDGLQCAELDGFKADLALYVVEDRRRRARPHAAELRRQIFSVAGR